MAQRPTNQVPRKRQLNVVYFVDSSRTRSFRIPLRRLNVIVGLLAVMTVWTVVSVGVIGFLANDRVEMTGRLQNALAVIFDYETRYDRVYEKAYPADGRLVTPLSQKKYDPPPAAPADQTSDLVSVNNASAVSNNQKTVKETTKAKLPDAAQASSDEDQINVSDPVIEETSSAVELRFKIKNLKSPSRVEGYIWAIAEFQQKGGKKLYIGSPSTIDVNSAGKINHKERAHRFSIRHYKRKHFRFPLPKNQEGNFIGIQIGVQHKSGEETTYDVPVDIQIGSKTESESTPENKSGSVNTTDPKTNVAKGG